MVYRGFYGIFHQGVMLRNVDARSIKLVFGITEGEK